MNNTEKRVKEIIVERLAVKEEKVIPQASLRSDLGSYSLDDIELVMAFEDEFDIEIPDEDAEKLKTVKDVVKYIESKV